ncbi:MAG: hypothetical protein KGD58_19075, partial [Candidatus Lokiarchaeota archaeon]|nr:hypothetical protein [Candidatus Lokiarchaeota archaeon]
MSIGINKISFVDYSNDISKFKYLDAFGIVGLNDYSEKDNTNSYGLQTELEQDFLVDYNYGIEYSIQENSNYYNNFLNITDNSNTKEAKIVDSFIPIENGIIEFTIKSTETLYRTMFQISDDLNVNEINFRIESNVFKYYDISYHTICSAIDNELYFIKIEFDCNSHWNITINDIFYGNYDYYGNPFEMEYIQILTHTINSGYSTVFDNIHYSWSNGYYENQIQDLIPLNDSKYNMYKGISESSESYIHYITPNNDISTQWTPELEIDNFECINEYPSVDSAYIWSGIPNQIDTYSFNSITNFTLITKLIVDFYVYRDFQASNTLRIDFYDGISWSEVKIPNIPADTYTWINVEWNNLLLNQSQIDNFQLRLTSPSQIILGNAIIIESLGVKLYG